MIARRLAAALAALAALAFLAGCSGDEPAPSAATGPVTALAADTLPAGIVTAIPFQNRLDVAAGRFQVKISNDTTETLSIDRLQFVWDGFTTAVTDDRHEVPGPNGRVDFPVPFPGATCVGDGTRATMPPLDGARVHLVMSDGSERSVPVYDLQHFAETLYLDDCEQQMIARQVTIEWADLRAATFEQRPVTEGVLRLTRRAATGAITVLHVSNTINFTATFPDAPTGGPLAGLPSGEETTEVAVRFVEGRCDTHALAESSQPFQFVAVVDLGDGVEHPWSLVPPAADRQPMKDRVEDGCAALGKVEVVGQGAVPVTAP